MASVPVVLRIADQLELRSAIGLTATAIFESGMDLEAACRLLDLPGTLSASEAIAPVISAAKAHISHQFKDI
jgi:hypothetical protein